MKLKIGIVVMLVGIIVLGVMVNNVSAACESVIKGSGGINLNVYKIFGECEVVSERQARYTQIESAATYWIRKFPFFEYKHSKEPTPRWYCYVWAYSYAYPFSGGAQTRADTCCC